MIVKEYNLIMKIIRVICALTLTFAVAFTALFGWKKISEESLDKTPSTYKGVITMWQIDCFEGGTGSRKQFLLKSARAFEKKNNGVLVMVTDYTVEGAKNAVKEGKVPDLISYGIGAEQSGFVEINPKRVSKGGLVGEKCFATAWCRGNYVLIYNTALVESVEGINHFDSLLVSQNEFTQPLTAFTLEGYSANNVEIKKPMDAYVKFVSGKTPYFLATQRDVVRLKNRAFEFGMIALSEYCDLYQYVSVCSKDPVKSFYAQEFVSYLLSDSVQTSLNGIGMYSDFTSANYDETEYCLLQNTNAKHTVSAFTPAQKLKEMQEISALAVKGDSVALNKIKNILI